MNEINQKVLEFLEILIENKILKYRTQFWNELNFSPTNVDQIKKGKVNFTINHLSSLKKYNINYNWLYGNEKNEFINNEFPERDYENVLYHKSKVAV